MEHRVLHNSNRTNIQEQKYVIKPKEKSSKGFWGKIFGSSSKEKDRRLESNQSQGIGRYVVTEHPRNVGVNNNQIPASTRQPLNQPRPRPHSSDNSSSTLQTERVNKEKLRVTTENNFNGDLNDNLKVANSTKVRNQGPPELDLGETSVKDIVAKSVNQKQIEPEGVELSIEEIREETPDSPLVKENLEEPTTPTSCCSPASSDHTQSSPLPSPTRITINDRNQLPGYLKTLQKAVRSDIPPPWSQVQPYPRMPTDQERVPIELFYERNLIPSLNNQNEFIRAINNNTDENSDCSSDTSSSYEDIGYGPHSVVRTPFGPQINVGQQGIPPNLNHCHSALRRSCSAPNTQSYANQPPIIAVPDVPLPIPNLNVMPNMSALPIALIPSLPVIQAPSMPTTTNQAFNYVPSPMEPSQYHYAAYAYPGLPTISFMPESKLDLAAATPHRTNIQSPPVTTPPNPGYVDEVIVAPYRDKSPQWGKEGKNIS